MNAVRRSDGRRQIGHEPTERRDRDREGSVPPRAAASAAHGLKLREIALREKAESTRVITRERNGWIDNAAPPARAPSVPGIASCCMRLRRARVKKGLSRRSDGGLDRIGAGMGKKAARVVHGVGGVFGWRLRFDNPSKVINVSVLLC